MAWLAGRSAWLVSRAVPAKLGWSAAVCACMLMFCAPAFAQDPDDRPVFHRRRHDCATVGHLDHARARTTRTTLPRAARPGGGRWADTGSRRADADHTAADCGGRIGSVPAARQLRVRATGRLLEVAANGVGDRRERSRHQGPSGVRPAGPPPPEPRRVPSVVAFSVHLRHQQPVDHMGIHGAFRYGRQRRQHRLPRHPVPVREPRSVDRTARPSTLRRLRAPGSRRCDLDVELGRHRHRRRRHA